MWVGEVLVDFNGIVLFDPSLLMSRYGGSIATGTDLFTKYTTTEEGDEVLAAGLIAPILAIDDGGYDIIIRMSQEPSSNPAPVLVTNGIYPLAVRDELVLADLVVLKEWIEGVAWQHVEMAPGNYAVMVNGFRQLNSSLNQIIKAGYEFVFDPCDTLPPPTADLAKNMNVLRLDILGPSNQLQ